MQAGRLWAGGAATALVAALTSIVGYMVIEQLLGIEVLGPAWGWFGGSQVATLAVHAGFSALVATALVHLLSLTTPRPLAFFGWIASLMVVVATLWPFTVSADLGSKAGSALIYLIVGIAIISLVTGVARTARVVDARQYGPRPGGSPPPADYWPR